MFVAVTLAARPPEVACLLDENLDRSIVSYNEHRVAAGKIRRILLIIPVTRREESIRHAASRVVVVGITPLAGPPIRERRGSGR